jgi:protein-tyrosine-phosphatase
MAEGFARKFGQGVIEAYSAGSRPSGKVNPEAVRIMAEAGIDISGHQSKGFQELLVKQFDWVVTMGCGDACPFVPAKHRLDWKIDDPKGRDTEFFCKIRDTIGRNVKELIQQISFSQEGDL